MPWLLLVATGVAGCASSQARSYEPPTRVSSSPPYVAGPRGAGVEMEDDGVPVQPPPVARRASEPDDPSEPFSPNYGRTGEHTSVHPGVPAPAGLAPAPQATFAPATLVRRSYVVVTR